MKEGPSSAAGSRATLRVLLVEDKSADAELVLHELEKNGLHFLPNVVETTEEFTHHLRSKDYDVVLADYNLPGWTGLEAFGMLQSAQKDIPFILVTGTLGDEIAVQSIKCGMDDYVLKDHLTRLPLAVQQALGKRTLRRECARTARENTLLRVAIEQATDAVFITDAAETIGHVNPALTRLTGYDRSDVLGRVARLLQPGQEKDSS